MTRLKGRPITRTAYKDFGTPELQEKRRFCITIDPLDLCLNKSIITQNQYSAGIQLRWLYTLTFGSPHITAYDLADLGGRFQSKYKDGRWLSNRYKEYKQCIKELKVLKAEKTVMDICIYGLRPLFFNTPTYCSNAALELMKFKNGLDSIYNSISKIHYR